LLNNSKTAFITGSEGFIGSHLTEALVRAGYKVKAFVLYNSFNSWGWLDSVDADIKNSVEICVGDIRDSHGVKRAMANSDVVLHLAALIAIPYSYRSPDSYIETNVRGTLNVLEAARELGIEKIVHTSTSEVYGSAQYVPIDELHPLQGQSPYSASKIGADQIAYSYHASFDLPVITLRPFNTYGPRQSARAIIPTAITQILSGTKSIKLGSLSPTRDYTFVSDTVSGFIHALNSKNGLGEVINLGSNFEISIGNLVNRIAGLLGSKVQIEEDPQRLRPRNSEVERLWADNSKAKELLGWEPEIQGLDGLDSGLRKTIEWFSNPSNLQFYKANLYNV